MISQKLKVEVYLSNRRAYEIAHEAGLTPSVLSRLLNGIDKVKPGDERIIRVGEIVGVPAEECFTAQNKAEG